MSFKNTGFSVEQAYCLAGLSRAQLSDWERTGLFVPQYVAPTRGYSFCDVVSLRTLVILKKRYKVHLQRLREIGNYLSRQDDELWSRITLYVVGSRVFYGYQEAQAGMIGQQLEQRVISFPIQRVSTDVADYAELLGKRDTAKAEKIMQSPYIMRNEPVLKGTRISTLSIWNWHSAGYFRDEIMREYPTLSLGDIVAAIEYEGARRERKAG